jgi:LPS sulfotransferase NodH
MTWWRDDPVLILGMHRSGTTLLAQQLQALGVFVGHRLEQNHEAVACLDLNDRVLARAHAAWDRPSGIVELIEHEPAARAVAASMEQTLRSLQFRRSYLGTSRMMSGLPPGPWGFKDPRTTVTWPLWLRVMPRARVLSVRRHGIDVAASLWRRATKELQEPNAARFAGDDHLARFASVRCLSLERAFELWKENGAIHRRFVAAHPQMPIFEFLYEDLLARPVDVLTQVVSFLGSSCSPEQIAAVAGQVKPERGLAHRNDPQLAEFVRRVEHDPDLADWLPHD